MMTSETLNTNQPGRRGPATALCLLRAVSPVLFFLVCLFPAAADDFSVTGSLSRAEDTVLLNVRVSVPPDHYLYSEQLSVSAEGNVSLKPRSVPPPMTRFDPASGTQARIYDKDVQLVYALNGDIEYPLSVEVRYQGCSGNICFLPAVSRLALTPESVIEKTEKVLPDSPSADTRWTDLLDRFTVTEPAAAYMPPGEFIDYLEKSVSGGEISRTDFADVFASRGVVFSLLIIIVMGFGLNLTPCVLPMIPINLGIMGAGVQAINAVPGDGAAKPGASRARGFALGSAYGAGIALTYGSLGLLAVLTGARFGSLNASPFFNLAVALVFGLMSLAMFDVFNIDLTKLQGTAGSRLSGRGTFGAAFLLGCLAALLAGACVAPVLISVLLFSADLYSRGVESGLLLPFLLGLGMALPWPFAAAGISFLPRAGKWMTRIKQVFGVIILTAALYYGYRGVSLLMPPAPATESRHLSLAEGMKRAFRQEKPLFIDFWAEWCRACIKMDKTTFRDPEVRKALEDFVTVKFDATRQDDPEVKRVLDRFVETGLPTCVVLLPQHDSVTNSPTK
ncbi:MAG: cytochrome c biogenesis protein CcdA [Kiritimatiellia bacterium]